MAGAQMDMLLWLLTVGTAVAGGVLSLWGTARQRKDLAAGTPRGLGYRLMMSSYVLMSVSISIFVVRGLL